MEENVREFVETGKVMAGLSDLLHWREAGLSAMCPLVRASEDGLHRLLVPLVRRRGDEALLSSIAYCDARTGAFTDSEDAGRFLLRHGRGELARYLKVTREEAAGVGKAGREELFHMLDGIRERIASSGECPREQHFEYLRRLLFPLSDEMADALLLLARGYETSKSREVACPSCGRRFSKDVSDCVPGQLVLMDCPYCRGAVRVTYKREGRCVSFRDAYFQSERGIFGLPGAGAGKEEEADALLEGRTFSLSAALEEDAGKEGKKAQRAEWDAERTASENAGEPAREFLRKLPEGEESAARADGLVGLAGIKKVFGVIRFIAEGGDYPLAQAYRVTGGPGMGILAAARCLSGTDGVVFSTLSELSAGALSGERGKAILIPLGGEAGDGPSLYRAARALDKSNVVFLTGEGEVPSALSALVLQTIRFRPYSDAELFAIYRQKLRELGDVLFLSEECEKRYLGRLSSSLDAARIARETHFRHLSACVAGKQNRGVIEERDFEKAAREFFPLPRAVEGGREGKA